MASAFAAFANGGYYIEPSTVVKIEYRDTGEEVEFNSDKERVMSDSTAYLMNNVLQYAVEYGFNGGARVYGSTVAAKTGTSNLDDETIERLGLPYGAVNDLWTVAYTPEYSISLWYGYEKVTSEHYLSGASAPKDALMQSVMKYIPKTTKQFTKPESVVSSQVEMGTWPAQLPSEYTPSDLILTEYFKKGTQPTETSERFSKLNNITNLDTKTNGRSITLSWDYKVPEVVTEEYLKSYFSQSVFGNGTNKFVQERLSYNENTLGGLGFGIYLVDENDEETLLAFTKDTEITVNIPNSYTSRNATLIVKTEYGSFKSNSSTGVSTEVSISGSSVNNDLDLDIGSSIETINQGGFKKEEIIVTYGSANVTNSTKITYQLFKNSASGQLINTYTNYDALVNNVNSLSPGIYVISYTAEFNNQRVNKKKTINIK